MYISNPDCSIIRAEISDKHLDNSPCIKFKTNKETRNDPLIILYFYNLSLTDIFQEKKKKEGTREKIER